MTRLVGFLLFSLCVSSVFGNNTQQLNNNMNFSDNCGLCEWGVTQIDSFLSSNYTETKIETAVTDLCNHLPGAFSSLCNQVVVPNIPTIINDLENKESPETICTQLNFCHEDELNDFFSHFSSPDLYGLMMFMKEHLHKNQVLNNYIMDTMNNFCF
jgi:hypothetical protein